MSNSSQIVYVQREKTCLQVELSFRMIVRQTEQVSSKEFKLFRPWDATKDRICNNSDPSRDKRSSIGQRKTILTDTNCFRYLGLKQARNSSWKLLTEKLRFGAIKIMIDETVKSEVRIHGKRTGMTYPNCLKS